MSRSGYSDDLDNNWTLIRYRGMVASAIRGKRGQGFLRDLLEALDTMPNKRLIASNLESNGEVCAIGSLGKKRGIDMGKLDPFDQESVAGAFGIAPCLSAEIAFENDQDFFYSTETPEQRWRRMRAWVSDQIKPALTTPEE